MGISRSVIFLGALLLLAPACGAEESDNAVVANETAVFWVESDGAIFRAEREGAAAPVLVDGAKLPRHLIAADASHVYWVSRNRVYRTPLAARKDIQVEAAADHLAFWVDLPIGSPQAPDGTLSPNVSPNGFPTAAPLARPTPDGVRAAPRLEP